MSPKLKFVLLFLIISISIVLSSCTPDDGPREINGIETATFNLEFEPTTIDPQLTTTYTGMIVDGMCMEGLLNFGKENGEVSPGVADQVKVSEDGKTWLFHIRDNAKWSTGEKISAHDFVFGLKRALQPNFKSKYAYLLFDIQNAKEFNSGKVLDFSKVGVRAVDDSTLEIRLSKPVPYFKQILTLPVTFPINKEFQLNLKSFYSIGNQYDPSKMLYNGPYIIEKWIPENYYIFKKNPNYWNAENIKLEQVQFLVVNDHQAVTNLYNKGQLDMTRIYSDQLKAFKGDSDLHKVNTGTVWYLEFNTEKQLFSNAKVRQAFSMVIDRTKLCKEIKLDSCIPAYAFVAPDISGGKINGKSISFRERFNKKYCKYDVKQAKELFRQGLNELGMSIDDINTSKTPITVLCDNLSTSTRDMNYFIGEVKKNLGIDLKINPVDQQSRLFMVDQKTFDIAYTGWSPDFDDPVSVLGMWVSSSGNNTASWDNENYDKIIDQSQSELNQDKRMMLLSKAESILMESMPIIPLYYPIDTWLIREWLKGYAIRTSGILVGFNNAYIKE